MAVFYAIYCWLLKKKGKKKGPIFSEVSISILIMIGLLFVTGWGLFYSLPGDVQPVETVLFGFIRGYDSFNKSDCLVLGIIWENSGGEDEIIENPELIVEKLDEYNEITKTYSFVMIGDFSEINDDAIAKGIERKFAYIFEPHSKIIKYMVFRPKNYWDESVEDEFKFKFNNEYRYRISIKYSKEFAQVPEKYLFVMPIYETVNNMVAGGNYSYDFFQVEKK